jgi:hypothetical protein
LFREIPFYVLWGIWKYRNKIMFENYPRNDLGLFSRIVVSIKEFPSPTLDENFSFMLSPVYFDNRPLGFFDGAEVQKVCGAGMLLKLSGFCPKKHVIPNHIQPERGSF